MTSHFSKTLILWALLILPIFNLAAQEIPDKPDPPRLVNDFGGFMSNYQVSSLEKKLRNFNDTTSTQIAIVTVKSLDGYDISDYAFRLGEKWGIGQANKDNGILILASKNDRKVFIATGYGVEEYLPDGIAKRIVDMVIIPNFKSGDFYNGFDQAVDYIMGLVSGKFSAEDLKKDKKIPWVYILIIFLLFGLSSLFRRNRYTSYSGRGYRGGTFVGGFGGGFGGGSSGGGFGGFGGGSFGGGGAGGSW